MPSVKRRNKKASTSILETVPVDPGATGAPTEAQPSNNVAKPRRTLRGRRGSLQDLPQMPLDILFEVFAHMGPLDLLHLARTSKSFRTLLTSKSSLTFWKAARRNIDGLPDCPPFMSEPAFANLLFCSNCHGCLKPNIKVVLWQFLARYCGDCKTIMTVSQRSMRLPGIQSWEPLILQVLPMIIERSNKSRMTERKALVRDVEALSKLLAPVSGDPAKKESVLAEPKEYTKKINEFTFACAEWYENKKESRSQELDQIRRTRLMAVVAKLRGLGWDEELNYMDDHGYLGLSRLSSVKQAKPLTDRTWANIRKSVEDFMTEAKTLRLAEVRRGILKDRFQILRQVVHKWRQTSDVLFPNVRDFASMDEVRTIVDIPTSVVLTPESFDVLLPMLPDLVAKWRRDADKQLVDRLRSSCNIGCAEGVELLSLATTAIFSCTRCSETRSYPEVLTHCCPYYTFHHEDNVPDAYTASANSAMTVRPWSPVSLRPLQNARHLLTLCELDPLQATQADLDTLDPRFVCDSCDGNGFETVMTWRCTVTHSLDMHGSPYGIASRIKKASEEHATAAREVERAATEKIAARADMKARGGWQCASCPVAKFVTKNSVTQHLRSEHGKMDNYEDTDYYLHPDSIPDVADPVCLISSKKDQAYLPMKVTVAMQQGLTAVRDDVSMANTYRYMSRAGAGIYDFDEDEDDFLYDHEYGEYYGMSDDELDFPWY